MKDWEKWGFEPIDTYARPPKNQRQIELCYAIFFASSVPEAQEILQSPAGERILHEAKNHGWTTHKIAKEVQNYVDYVNEQGSNAETANAKETITNGSGE